MDSSRTGISRSVSTDTLFAETLGDDLAKGIKTSIQFGDGIISAINFKLHAKKVADPEGGERGHHTRRQVPLGPAEP